MLCVARVELPMAYIVLANIVMGYIAMAYTVLANMVMGYIAMACCRVELPTGMQQRTGNCHVPHH